MTHNHISNIDSTLQIVGYREWYPDYCTASLCIMSVFLTRKMLQSNQNFKLQNEKGTLKITRVKKDWNTDLWMISSLYLIVDWGGSLPSLWKNSAQLHLTIIREQAKHIHTHTYTHAHTHLHNTYTHTYTHPLL